MIKKLYVCLILLLGVVTSGFAQTFPNASWKYSVPVTISAGSSINSTVKINVNFATLLAALSVPGTLDVNSVRVVRPNGTLATIQEYNDNIFNGATNPTGNSRGEVAFILEDAGPAVYNIYFDITENGSKTENTQTPINGGFEKGTTGQTQPSGWNAPTVTAGYDAQVRPSENPTVITRTQGWTSSRTTDGTPNTGDYSYLIGDRTDLYAVNGGVTITKTINVPATNPGNLVFKYRIEGWDSSGFDYFRAQIISNTTANLVGPVTNNYDNYPFSPNYGGAVADNNNSGYGQYNGWDYDTGNRHRPQAGNSSMSLAKGSEPWFTVSYPLSAFAGRTVTLSFSTNQEQLFKSWVSIDDVSWSVISGLLGTPVEYNTSVNAANFECLETGTNAPYSKDSRDPLYTKITNTPFSFDVVALKSNGDVETNYVKSSSKSVTVELFDATTPNTCAAYTSPVASTTATFTSSSSGRITIPNLSSASAYSKLICRVRDSNPTTPVYGCSSDTLSIRPQSINSVSSSASADTLGVSSTASPTITAGNNFTITANSGTVGYNGIPKTNQSMIEWLNAPSYGVSQAISNGAGKVSGNFSNGALKTTGNGANGLFSYSEAGYFRFKTQGIYDDTFISPSADSANNDCIPNSFSNTLVDGKYGCNFGTTTPSPHIGRFIPSSFVINTNLLTNRASLTCSPNSNFTYLGELFGLTVSLKPINTSGQTTLNYVRTKLADTSMATWNLNVSNGLSSRLSISSYSGLWDSLGAFNGDLRLSMSRGSLPDGPFANTVISINPRDADNVSLLQSSLDLDANSDTILDSKNIGQTNFYFGRMKMNNLTGSDLLKMIIPLEVQYYNGAGFVTNTNDSCTPLTSANFAVSGFTQNIQSNELSFTYPVSFANGKQTIIMNKPSGGDGAYNGSFNITYNLGSANTPYLLGKWTGSTYSENPIAKIILSRQANKSRVFFLKDSYN